MNPVFASSPFYQGQVSASNQPNIKISNPEPLKFTNNQPDINSELLELVKTPAGNVELVEVDYNFILPDADIQGQDRKYCKCLLEVESKGRAYSPYGVCRNSTRGYVHSCSQYYNWGAMSLDMLIAYADLHKVDSSQMTSRSKAIQLLGQWKASRQETF